MKRIIRLKESDLHKIITESVNRVLNEWTEEEILAARKQAKLKENIEIKPENKGKFNATKKRTGKSTEELTHSKNPLTRKRAIFAQNVKKWNHSGK